MSQTEAEEITERPARRLPAWLQSPDLIHLVLAILLPPVGLVVGVIRLTSARGRQMRKVLAITIVALTVTIGAVAAISEVATRPTAAEQNAARNFPAGVTPQLGDGRGWSAPINQFEYEETRDGVVYTPYVVNTGPRPAEGKFEVVVEGSSGETETVTGSTDGVVAPGEGQVVRFSPTSIKDGTILEFRPVD